MTISSYRCLTGDRPYVRQCGSEKIAQGKHSREYLRFVFCVLSVGNGKNIPEEVSYLSFQEYDGPFKVIFTAVDKLSSGEWPVIGSGPIVDQKMVNLEFHMAGDLYVCGEFVKVLPGEKYKDYLEMAVAGFVLVDRYLKQH